MNYSNMIYSKNQVFDLRISIVGYALEYGLRATSRFYACSRNTVRKWLRRYAVEGKVGLSDRSRAPKRIPHKTSSEVESIGSKVQEARSLLWSKEVKGGI